MTVHTCNKYQELSRETSPKNSIKQMPPVIKDREREKIEKKERKRDFNFYSAFFFLLNARHIGTRDPFTVVAYLRKVTLVVVRYIQVRVRAHVGT